MNCASVAVNVCVRGVVCEKVIEAADRESAERDAARLTVTGWAGREDTDRDTVTLWPPLMVCEETEECILPFRVTTHRHSENTRRSQAQKRQSRERSLQHRGRAVLAGQV